MAGDLEENLVSNLVPLLFEPGGGTPYVRTTGTYVYDAGHFEARVAPFSEELLYYTLLATRS